jgi:hypothetical protein
MRHATALFFLALFLKNKIHVSFPFSRCDTARKLPGGTCVIDSSLQAGFLRTRGSQRSRISLFSVIIRSQTSISLFVGAHISDSFPTASAFQANRIYVLYAFLSSNSARNLPTRTSKTKHFWQLDISLTVHHGLIIY